MTQAPDPNEAVECSGKNCEEPTTRALGVCSLCKTEEDVWPEPKTGMWLICDRCKLKTDATDHPSALHFMHEHVWCVFNGLRTMAMNFPCPNQQRRYKAV